MTVLAEARPLARLVQRRIATRLDPFSLHVALGAGPDTALFEGMRGTTLLMHQAAVRAECRGEVVRLTVLSANGESLLRGLAATLGDAVADGTGLTLRIPHSRSLDAEERLRAPAPLHAVRALLRAAMPEGEEPFAAAMLGAVAFDHAGLGEDLPEQADDPVGFPDFLFWVPETLLLIEPGVAPRVLCAAFEDAQPELTARNHHDAVARLERVVRLCAEADWTVRAEAASDAPEAQTDLDDAAYADVVRQMKTQIAAGEVYQIVPSRTFSAPCADPVAAYAALRLLEPGSYRFFVTGADFTLLGASPETAVRVFREEGADMVEVRPIAGTRARGATQDEDDRLESELRLDGKEIAEHMMLVDLARNDVARISEGGTRRVARLMSVERYARVMHLVSSVTGRLDPCFDAFDALATCLNVGTLTGAPKIRAMQLLRGAERTRRGHYGGALGWINGAGAMDTVVVIRSALVRDGIAHVRAGAGVVHDSDPMAEAEETRRKASALLSVLSAQRTEARP